ncbi:hypothetical protein I4U23_023126 [Adineta vaga]|nr:hypothetical protein I4U23_023126 [Adineta vaga]
MNSSRLLHVSRLFQSANLYHIIKTIGYIILFLLASPLPFVITCVTLILHSITRKPQKNNPNAKRILISNGGKTKSLQLVRSFYSAGHYVVLTESYPYATNRYSRCVSRFYLSADSNNEFEYIQSIVDIVQRERIDYFIPVSHSSTECLDARIKRALIPFNCETIHGDLEQVQILCDKYAFMDRARSFDLTVPKSYRITDPKQILTFDFSKEKCQFILKRIEYDFVNRTNLVKLPCDTREQMINYLNSLVINEEYPWIMQEFIIGKEYCTHGTVKNGELRLHVCCESLPWLLNYKHVDNKLNILNWVKEFCSKANTTGQIAFDFIESYENGLVYPLECNARTHTAITTFSNHPLVAEAYLGTERLLNEPIQPKSNARLTYWLYHELWNIFKIRNIQDLIKQWKVFLHGKEALYSVDDPLPFFLHYTVHLPRMIIYHLLHIIPFDKIDCNLSFCF